MSISSLFNLGWNALNGAQSAIQTTGNNIANVNTPGYSRQEVRFEEAPTLDKFGGQMGQGVYAAEVIRHFNKFLFSSYLDKYSTQQRWEKQYEELQGVENLFNEANTSGINAALTTFFNDWQELSKRPDDKSVREALLAHSDNLTKLIRNADDTMLRMQQEIDQQIGQDVDAVNDMLRSIADINRQLNIHDDPGRNNANTLYDQRDQLVRKLAEKLDVTVVDNGGGNYTVNTKAGQTLVDGTVAYELRFDGPKSEAQLTTTSAFDGTLEFTGSDSSEYTLEVVTGGAVGTATYRVSLDGGQTWLKDADGNELHYTTQTSPTTERVKGLDISFTGATQPMSAGDRFTITPKSGLYWVTPTRDPLNVTPQALSDGTDNTSRITGGSLGALFTVRDDKIGEYRDKLDAFANTLMWEVNRIHSQGAGLEKLAQSAGTTKVPNTTASLGSPTAGINFHDRLQDGNIGIYVYDKTTRAVVNSGSIDFSSVVPPGLANFSKDDHSLQDVVDAINNDAKFTGLITASIKDGKLVVDGVGDNVFSFGADSTGVLAALGLNTFFQGSGAADIALRPELRQNTGLINAGQVNGASEGNSGDNNSAKEIAALSTKKVTVSMFSSNSGNQSLSEFYSSIVAVVGADTASAKFNKAFHQAMSDDIDSRMSSVSGVNLDEEMASLVKFQHSYKAAAKLVTTADEMFQVLLGLKQ